MTIKTDKLQWFFTFIGKDANKRIIGYTTALIIALSWIVWYLLSEHFERDVEFRRETIKKDSIQETRIKFLEEKNEEKDNRLIEYVMETTRRNDSITYHEKKFIEELKKK